MKHIMQMVEYYIIFVNIQKRKYASHRRDKICEIPNLILAYITVHYSAVSVVTMQMICFYVSRKALKASVYFV